MRTVHTAGVLRALNGERKREVLLLEGRETRLLLLEREREGGREREGRGSPGCYYEREGRESERVA